VERPPLPTSWNDMVVLSWWCFRDYCRGCVLCRTFGTIPWSLLHVVGGVAWWCSVFGRCACVILGQTPNFLLEDWIRKKNFNCRGGRTEELIVQYYLARLRRRTATLDKLIILWSGSGRSRSNDTDTQILVPDLPLILQCKEGWTWL
jgi:hypothetical protein